MKISLRWTRFVLCIAVMATTAAACGPGARFEVISQSRQHLMRSPDSVETPFANILDSFHDMVEGWVDLIPGMELRLEKAFFHRPEDQSDPRYVGTETLRYALGPDGRLIGVERVLLTAAERRGEESVQVSVPEPHLDLPYHRVFLQLIVRETGELLPAALLSATSPEALIRASTELDRTSDSACFAVSTACTVFSTATLAAPDIRIVVNGQSRMVPLTTRLSTVVRGSYDFEVRRLHEGVSIPVEMDPADPDAVSFFLLPGDEIFMR